jgi:hypothetical protein
MNGLWNFIGFHIISDILSDFYATMKSLKEEPTSTSYFSKKRKAIGSIMLVAIVLTLLSIFL